MRPAGFWDRVMAVVIDWAILLPLGLLTVILATYVSLYVGIGFKFVTIPIGFFYSVYFLSLRGQTIGKKVMRVKIVRMDGGRVTRREAILRNLIDLVYASLNGFITTFGALAAAPYSDKLSEYQGFSGTLTLLNKGTESGFGSFLGYISVIYALAQIISFYATPERQAIHDLLAGTRAICWDEQSILAANAANEPSQA